MKLENVKMLGLAITKLAVNDYNKAIKQLKLNPKYSQALNTKTEIESLDNPAIFTTLIRKNFTR
jgi:hypothetical protein